MRVPNEVRKRWLLPVFAALALPLQSGAQPPRAGNLYVAEVVGSWVASVDGKKMDLRPLMRVSSTARFQLIAGDTTSRIALRDPRSQVLYRRLCSVEACTAAFVVTDLRDKVAPRLTRSASAESLYAYLDQGAEIHERIRLVGARGSERELGIVVLTYSGNTVELGDLLAKIRGPRERLVARFCRLTGDIGDADECIESRRRMPNDCDLAASACAVPDASAAAYRVDVYTRERSMLGSLAEASGFAAIVPATARLRAVALRDSLAATLEALAPALAADERRGLAAAAALRVARNAR